MIVADSDVLIDFLRGTRAAERVAKELDTGRLATTAISAFELVVGATTARRRAAVDDLLAALLVLPLTDAAARKSGAIHQRLAAAGNAIGMADALIAGTCLAAGATLLTFNLRHFSRVEGLTLAEV